MPARELGGSDPGCGSVGMVSFEGFAGAVGAYYWLRRHGVGGSGLARYLAARLLPEGLSDPELERMEDTEAFDYFFDVYVEEEPR